MKIVHVISSFYPGGAEALVRDIALNTSRNHSVQVWAVGNSGNKNFEENFKEVLNQNKVIALNIGKIAHKNRMRVVMKVRKLIKQHKPDIINTHSELATFLLCSCFSGIKC